MVLPESVRLFDQLDKINHRLRFYCTINRSSPINNKLYSISFFKSGILLQQPKAPLKGVSAHFSNMCRTILKEKREREIFDLLGRLHNSISWTHFPQTRSCNQNGGVLELFSRFRRGTENRGFIRIQNFFRKSISNNKWIRCSEKNTLGLGAL